MCSPEIVELQFFPLEEKLAPGMYLHPSSINQNVPGSGSTFTQPVNFHPFLFGRFPVEKYVPISSERSYPFCERFAPQNGFPYFMEEVGAHRLESVCPNKSQELVKLREK
jgi:hypothetical protein